MHIRISAAGLVGVFLTVTGCGSTATDGRTVPSAAASSGSAPASGPTSLAPNSAQSAAGGQGVTWADLPTPSAADEAAYLADLNKIDPAIVTGRRNTRVIVPNSMGTCLSLANHRDPRRILLEAKFGLTNEQIELTDEQGTRIIEAIRRDLCPMY